MITIHAHRSEGMRLCAEHYDQILTDTIYNSLPKCMLRCNWWNFTWKRQGCTDYVKIMSMQIVINNLLWHNSLRVVWV